jgi:hypothetical protein
LLASVETNGRAGKSKALLDIVEKCIKAIQLSTDSNLKKRLRSKATELMNRAESLEAEGEKPTFSNSERPPRSYKPENEPQSTRKLSNAEKRLILLASRSNGMKFPPWTRTPNADDFALSAGPDQPIRSSNDGLFLDSAEFSLCQVQKENFQAWLRSPSAIPPPTWFGEDELSPIMKAELPTDLVQDAVPDCSVVASICVEQSRAQRGFRTVRYPSDDGSGTNPNSCFPKSCFHTTSIPNLRRFHRMGGTFLNSISMVATAWSTLTIDYQFRNRKEFFILWIATIPT